MKFVGFFLYLHEMQDLAGHSILAMTQRSGEGGTCGGWLGGEKEPCHLPSQESAEHPLRRRADRVPIALQLDRGLPEGKARHQHIIDQAQQRDGIRD